MKLLLVNSNTEDSFVALYSEPDLIVSRTTDYIVDSDLSGQSSLRPPDKLIQCLSEIARRLEAKGSSLEDIDAISVIIGPGSFTGIRVGLAIAKGTADALDKKIIPIDNFELTLNRLNSIDKEKNYCVLIPAKLPEYYFSVRKNGSEISSGYGEISTIRSIIGKDTAVVGDFSNEFEEFLKYFEVLNTKGLKTELDSMVELSVSHFNEGRMYPSEKIEPLYLKDFIAKRKN